mmetsp:Transcript_35809/g.112032  ORF Transcript_35809/g.112032 Transcript_35809/m.112032 type:complete len:149 (-) Transcript_35809:370-816(-)
MVANLTSPENSLATQYLTSSSVTNWEAQKLSPLIFCARSDRLAQFNLNKLSATLARGYLLVHGGLLRDGSSHQGGDALRNGSADGLRVVKTGFYTPDLSHQFDHFHFSAFCLQHMRKQGDEHTKSHEQKTKSDSKRNHAMLQSTLLFR